MLPSAPLVALVERRGGLGGQIDPTTRRAYDRAKSSGSLTPFAADELTHAVLGCHPCEVWPREWFGPYGLTV